MSGHLFIVRGDITKLSCDAWLSTGDGDGPGSGWIKQNALGRQSEDGRSMDRGRFAGQVVRWRRYAGSHGPQPWFADVLADPVGQVLEYLRQAAASMDGVAPRAKRAKPLLAIPLAGVGKAGHAKRAGEVLAALLPRILAWLEQGDVDVDVALVLRTDPHYFASQYVRANLTRCWRELGEEREQLRRLAMKALKGQLVLFLGAGVSMGAGLPSWTDLLDELLRKIGKESQISEQLAQEINKLNHMDQPQVLEALYDQSPTKRRAFKHVIKDTIDGYGDRYSLNHAMLSVLPVVEAVTTNYDQLFEQACYGAGRECYRIPWEKPEGRKRWLLKMHGCTSRPDQIVLSRRDYSLYDAEYGVLASIVQAMLVTRHMLFVGFGMEDPNFRTIFDTVKHAVRDSSTQASEAAAGGNFGAALFLQESPVFKHLWQDDVEILAFSGPGNATEQDVAASARRLEIGLDYLAFECCRDADAPLLDPDLFQNEVVDEGDLKRLAEVRGMLETLSKKCSEVETSQLRRILTGKIGDLLASWPRRSRRTGSSIRRPGREVRLDRSRFSLRDDRPVRRCRHSGARTCRVLASLRVDGIPRGGSSPSPKRSV